MVDESGAIEQISFLTRSETRVRILTHLLETGPTTQRAFRDELPSSRSTVTRTLSALAERDWVEQSEGAYELTPQGHIVADGLDGLVERMQVTEELSTFIRWFPYAEYDVELDQFRGAEITVSTEPDPYAPSRAHAGLLQEAERFRMVLPSIDLQVVRTTEERVTAGDMTIELIVSSGIEETILNDEFAAAIRAQMEAGGMTVLVADEPVPFYLGLSGGETVQVGVEDDEGFPRALVESDDESLREWAEDVYESIRESAREKPIEEFEP